VDLCWNGSLNVSLPKHIRLVLQQPQDAATSTLFAIYQLTQCSPFSFVDPIMYATIYLYSFESITSDSVLAVQAGLLEYVKREYQDGQAEGQLFC
jgi:hypothetical protein